MALGDRLGNTWAAIRRTWARIRTKWGQGPGNSTAHMLSEFLREAAVLVFVFVPLDWLFEPTALALEDVIIILSGAGALLALGIVIERLRT